ncbi:MAG: DUF885 domain-containing protein [Myxococcales bacterium]|nr:DUF885 domain-containing protein [Myxococcales bacterium]
MGARETTCAGDERANGEYRARMRWAPFVVFGLAISCGADPLPTSTAPRPSPSASSRVLVTTTSRTPRRDEDELFGAISARFLEQTLELRPDVATSLGDHRRDGHWPDLSEQGDAKERALYDTVSSELDGIDETRLSEEARVDFSILRTQVAFARFSQAELRPLRDNPLEWTALMGDGLDPFVSRDFAPLATRLQSLASRLNGLPTVVEQAKARLGTPSRVHTETAIEQNRGLIALVATGLEEHLNRSPAARGAVAPAAKRAETALRDFQQFLEGTLLPRSTADFRLGPERFEKKLRFVLDDPEVSPRELADSARALLTETRDAMVETALAAWPELMKGPPPKSATAAEKRGLVRSVLAKLAEDRPTNTSIVTEATEMLSAATTFVQSKDLVRIPEEACRVIEMPEYRRGVSIAYCDSTGPLETRQESFYAIAPTPKDWSKDRVTSFYREYNRNMLRNLTVHEAMPGHFLQAMHANRFKSGVRAIYSSGPFVEGWAVYTEWLMAKHGFGGPKTRLMRQKMALRMAANAVLDFGIHAGAMDEKQALALMTEEAFQEEGEAVGKWKRARLTSTQLSTYYYGFREMMRLRLAAEKRPTFAERAFNDGVLAHGSPPMRHLRTLLKL